MSSNHVAYVFFSFPISTMRTVLLITLFAITVTFASPLPPKDLDSADESEAFTGEEISSTPTNNDDDIANDWQSFMSQENWESARNTPEGRSHFAQLRNQYPEFKDWYHNRRIAPTEPIPAHFYDNDSASKIPNIPLITNPYRFAAVRRLDLEDNSDRNNQLPYNSLAFRGDESIYQLHNGALFRETFPVALKGHLKHESSSKEFGYE
jgi:hypothetical protein